MTRGFFNSLSVRLLAALLTGVVGMAAIYAFVVLRGIEHHWVEGMFSGAERVSDLIKNATRYGMLLNRKEDVHQAIRRIAQGPGMKAVRIYDKEGRVQFSADDGEIGYIVDLEAEACTSCHARGQPLTAATDKPRRRVFSTNGTNILGIIAAIENGPDCSSAACHAHPADQKVLGVLDVQMSTAGMQAALKDVQGQMVRATALLVLGVMAFSTFFIQRMVRRPVRRLHEGTRRVAAGDLDVQVEVGESHELGELATAFNKMTGDLKRARGELTDWSEKLEHKVVEKTEELGRTQRQMVTMEKMASLGKLAATVAHELNNPLAGILTYSKLVKREIDDDTACTEGRVDTLRYLDLIQKESARCGSIVKNLLLFSRRSGVDFAPVHLTEVIERGTMLVRHHLEMANVKLEKVLLASDDMVICDPNQVEQALLALFVNAVEAMSTGGNGGTLTVRLLGNLDSVDVEVQDTGYGISTDVLPHIFEPFFSTKDKESGVGLGLAVVYGIVQRHSGTIDVASTVGQGTTFRIRLPRRPVAPADAASRPDGVRIHA